MQRIWCPPTGQLLLIQSMIGLLNEKNECYFVLAERRKAAEKDMTLFLAEASLVL
jgi:hypothetical protein